MELNFLEIILCVFFISLTVTLIFRKLRLSIILGYLLVGALLGPHAIGLMHNSTYAKNLAEFGIVFLMFTVGLEFSLPKLIALRYPVFVMGSLQVLLTILITTLCGLFLGMSKLAALTVGSIVAMSSTAIVVKQLSDQLELQSKHGLNAISILLFQDLAVIPLIILIAELAQGKDNNLFTLLIWALLKGSLAILLIFLVGRWLLKPLFHQISKTRDIELFTLTVLLVTLTAAWFTDLWGLSYALGAFLAGLMLAETEFRHQIEVEIRPFRDILLGLFFITIGMLADVSSWYNTWVWILPLFTALVFGKMLLITIITRLSGNDLPTATRTGIVLAQGGEFGFALLTLALSKSILPADYGQVVLAALLISMAISPILIRFNKEITKFCLQRKVRTDEIQMKQQISTAGKKLKQHIIICGYGRVGQQIARLLNKIKSPFIGLDLDSELIRFAALAGDNVFYGDPTHPGILKAAGLKHAKLLIISFNDLRASLQILSIVKQSRPDLNILVRCKDEFELKQLKSYGASHIVAEIFETSLTLAQHLLTIIDIPKEKASQLIHEMRSKDYDLLLKVFTGSYEETMADENAPLGQLKPILIPEGAPCINKKLKDINLTSTKAEIIAIRSGETKFLKPQSNLKIEANNIIIVYGTPAALESAENVLLGGK
jgi:CPA2 family monovalent cation:H+ antiporter-2